MKEPSHTIKIALAQLPLSGSLEENYQKAANAARQASAQGADLILFPEVQLSPFFAQYPDRDASAFVIRRDSPFLTGFQELCRTCQIYASPNFYVEENGNRYDMSFLIGPDGAILGTQKMVHVAQCEQFYEQSYYTPSEEGFSVFDTPIGRIGIVVCFDRHYPESIRTEALRGADLILIPTANTRAEPSDLFQWEIRVQAFQNSVNIAMCNRIGTEDQMDFCGASLVSDYQGNCLTQADDTETILYADVDLNAAAQARAAKPYTVLRRPELYEPPRRYPMDFPYCKIEIFLPGSHLRPLQKALQEVDAGHIGNYDSCLSYSPVTGTWRPLDGTTPYLGKQGEISEEPELKVEVTIRTEEVDRTLDAIRKVHPYEEPVINVLPLYRTSFD